MLRRRPRKNWLIKVEEKDLSTLAIKNWKMVAEYMKRWWFNSRQGLFRAY